MHITELKTRHAYNFADCAHIENSKFSQAKINFEIKPPNNVISAKGFSDGGLYSNIPIIKDALGQWAKQAQLHFSPTQLNGLSGLVALKMYSGPIQPGSREALELKQAADSLSQRLLPLAAQLSSKQFPGDEKPVCSGVNHSETLSTLKKGIINGIADPVAWQKKLKAELQKMPGWNEAPCETVEKCTKFCLNMVMFLNMCGPRNKHYTSTEQSEVIEKYKETFEHDLKKFSADLNKWIFQSKAAFPFKTFEKPEVQWTASNMLGNSLDRMIEEFSIRLISGGAMAGQNSQDKDYTGKYIDVRLTPVSADKNCHSKDNSYMCVISATQQSVGGYNGSIPFGGTTNPSSKQNLQSVSGIEAMGPEDPATSYQSAYGIGPLAPGARGGWFKWGMGNYGGFYRSLLVLSEKLVNDFESYAKGINADKFDMKAAAEFQVKTMQFVTTFGAVMKAISGALKQAKSVVDAVQA